MIPYYERLARVIEYEEDSRAFPSSENFLSEIPHDHLEYRGLLGFHESSKRYLEPHPMWPDLPVEPKRIEKLAAQYGPRDTPLLNLHQGRRPLSSLSEEERNEILKYRRAGLSLRCVKEKFNVSIETIYAIAPPHNAEFYADNSDPFKRAACSIQELISLLGIG